jgi:hypothetical protein
MGFAEVELPYLFVSNRSTSSMCWRQENSPKAILTKALLSSGFHLTGLQRHVTTSIHVSNVADDHRQDSNLGLPTYESGVVTTRLRWS